jgi:hypothetical protein
MLFKLLSPDKHGKNYKTFDLKNTTFDLLKFDLVIISLLLLQITFQNKKVDHLNLTFQSKKYCFQDLKNLFH